ncbi:hypothetical protein LTR15_011072 [Elasticomyces elasticus]|nr:hypothetical protein LTR15_011072 [Elasticomyces elasticus]
MALAASFAAQGMRPASFLPAIKCSSCGDEIEIASMGEHICGNAPPSPHAQPASPTTAFTIRQMNAHGHMPHAPSPLQQQQQQQQSKPVVSVPKTRVRAPTVNSNSLPAPKVIRPPPPRINPDAANKPFLAPMPPRSDSPMSPAMSIRSGSSQSSRPPPIRSATSPGPRIFDPRPPSPEMSGGFDSPFPIFAPGSAGSGGRPGTSNGRKTPTPSERAHSRGSSRHGSSRVPFSTDPNSPLSGENGSGKMGTLQGAPFDPNRRRPSDQAEIAQPMSRRRPSMSSIKFGREPPPIPSEPMPRPSTSHSNGSAIPRPSTANGHGLPSGQQNQRRGPPPRPERPAEDLLSPEPIVEMPSTFSPSQPPVPIRSADRSRTMPMRQGSDDTATQDMHTFPGEAQFRGRDPRPNFARTATSESSQIPQAANRQRSQSRSAPRNDVRLQDAPPVPRQVQQHRQEKSHASSESGSSIASSAASLGNSNSSSGPSPVGSAASSIDPLSPLGPDQRLYGDDERMRVPGLNVALKPGMRAEQPASRSPPRNFARPPPPREMTAPLRSPTLPALASPPLESPMDPAMQARTLARSATEPTQAAQIRPTISRTNTMPESRGQEPARTPAPPMPSLSIPQPGDDDYDPYRPTSPAPNTRLRAKSNAAPPQFQAYTPSAPQVLSPTQYQPSLRPRSPQPVQAPPANVSLRPISPQPPHEPPSTSLTAPRNGPVARRGPVVKPSCRGCGQIIEGKSVKAADGRLTGRWHKACFTCRACEQPFITADFYVINNHPYCEQHYHEENGSLCHGCHRGIEGQYLETTSSSTNGSVEKKFHPRCFTCCDCQEVLSEDYFEIHNKVYCERHALAAMRGQARMAGPGSGSINLNVPDKKALTAERRTTRLMMM